MSLYPQCRSEMEQVLIHVLNFQFLSRDPFPFQSFREQPHRRKKSITSTCTDQYIGFQASKQYHTHLVPTWQVVYFVMVTESNEKIILGLCKLSLTSEYPVVNWASSDTLTLLQACSCSTYHSQNVGTLECKIWKTVRFLANCHHQAKQGKVEAVLFTKLAEKSCVYPQPQRRMSFTVAKVSSLPPCCQEWSPRPFSDPRAKSTMCFYPTSCCTGQEFTAFPWRGPGGQVHVQPPWYTCVLATSV